jgi:hypothetical protein
MLSNMSNMPTTGMLLLIDRLLNKSDSSSSAGDHAPNMSNILHAGVAELECDNPPYQQPCRPHCAGGAETWCDHAYMGVHCCQSKRDCGCYRPGQ